MHVYEYIYLFLFEYRPQNLMVPYGGEKRPTVLTTQQVLPFKVSLSSFYRFFNMKVNFTLLYKCPCKVLATKIETKIVTTSTDSDFTDMNVENVCS